MASKKHNTLNKRNFFIMVNFYLVNVSGFLLLNLSGFENLTGFQ